jgi:hypothetical protein
LSLFFEPHLSVALRTSFEFRIAIFVLRI